MVNLYRHMVSNDFNKANTKIESGRIDYNVIVIYIEASHIKKDEGKNSKKLLRILTDGKSSFEVGGSAQTAHASIYHYTDSRAKRLTFLIF